MRLINNNLNQHTILQKQNLQKLRLVLRSALFICAEKSQVIENLSETCVNYYFRQVQTCLIILIS